jgi:hypothetical protein
MQHVDHMNGQKIVREKHNTHVFAVRKKNFQFHYENFTIFHLSTVHDAISVFNFNCCMHYLYYAIKA